MREREGRNRKCGRGRVVGRRIERDLENRQIFKVKKKKKACLVKVSNGSLQAIFQILCPRMCD